MMYDYVKAIHIIAVIIWVGAMCAISVLVGRKIDEVVVARWRLVMTVSILVTWVAGLYLALSAGWFEAGWMRVKIVLVAALSAFHGVLVGHLKRAVRTDEPVTQSYGAIAAPLLLVGVVFLVVLKPF